MFQTPLKVIKFNILSSSESKYKSILDFAPDAFILGDKKGNIIEANLKAVELLGYSREELLTMNFSELFSEDTLLEKPLRYDLLNRGETIIQEREIVTRDGRKIFVETNSRAMPDGNYQSFIRDISERKRNEERIRVSEERLTRAELISKSGNWELHLDSHKMVGSVGAAKIYGFDETTNELDFSKVKTVPLPEYRPMMDQALKELIELGKPYDIEFKIKALDTGEIKDIRSKSVFDKEKRILFGAIQDITQQKIIEEELIAAKEKAEESDALKSAFIQNLSHEIRTPMNAVIGFSELLRESFDDRYLLEKYTRIIQERAADLLVIISNILDLSILESGQLVIVPEKCNIDSLLAYLELHFSSYRERKGKQDISLHIHSSVDPSVDIISDEDKLKLVLNHLISNAFKFTEKGSVSIQCDIKNNKELCFAITDTGMGIPSDKREMIFERFIQLNYESFEQPAGNGLGLTIARGVAEMLGGKISLESEMHNGSTFYFTIPLEIPAQASKTMNQSSTFTNTDISGKVVLIVEDDVFNAEYLKEILDAQGIVCIKVDRGEDALEIVNSRPVDLVLMDIRLPGLNGYEITRKIRELKPDLTIIAQTAYASFNDRKKALDAGCDDYVSKPIRKELLLSTLQRHLSK